MADALSTGLSSVETLSVSDAAGLMGLTEPRKRPESEPEQEPNQPSPEDIGPAEDDDPDEGDDAAADNDQPPGDDDIETEDESDPADDLPPVEAPRSWTKAEKEAFAALPRAHQEALLDRDRAREKDIRTRQDGAAAHTKAAQAAEQAATQARDQYAAGIEQLAAQATSFVNGEFSDIKTWDDVANMQDDDPIRHGRWQVAVQRTQALQQENQRLQAENQQQARYNFQQYVTAETQKLLELAPEFADPKRAPQLQGEVRAMLTEDYGIPAQELAELDRGRPLSIHDHRLALIVRDALEYRKAKSRVATKTPKPAPPSPQKPGTPPVKGEVRTRALDQAEKELTRTGGRDAALALMRAKRTR